MVARFMGGVVTISQPWCKLESSRLVRDYLLGDNVIVSPHFLIRARGANFHFLAGQLIEKKRDSPWVAHLTVVVDPQSLRQNEANLLQVVAKQRLGDLGIGAHRIFAKAISKLLKHDAHFLELRFGGGRGELGCGLCFVWRSGCRGHDRSGGEVGEGGGGGAGAARL